MVASMAGLLEADQQVIPVEIVGHSRYSILVRLPFGADNAGTFESGRFTLAAGAGSYDLGRCRLLPADGIGPRAARVVFLDDQLEVAEALSRGRICVSDTGLFNLRLILNQKEKVGQAFKEFSADLVFELNVYKQFFDELDRKYAKEPESVREHLQQMVIEREGREFLAFFGEKVEALMERTANLSREENESHGFFFRNQVWEFILQSAFMTRTNLKPRGYAGDYQMMRMIYENEYVGLSIFAQLLHHFPVNVKAALAVRSRRRIIADAVTAVANARRPGDAPTRVMSVACGPAVELTDFLGDPSQADAISCTLLDQDDEALCAAKSNVAELEQQTGARYNIRYVNESVRSMLRIHDVAAQWGRYDLVYSMGLFDYLTPPVAKVVLEQLFQLLKPGGRIIVGNFHRANPDRTFMEYWLDWVLYYRTEEEMAELAASIPKASLRVFFEETGCQMFLELTANR
ncbi:MAG: class I SAM-dependent methyltransferase [Spirochaetia bacterium]|nr:class I SAM-dependent methyltransferase [Spirochaetia bacterium]